MEIYVYDSEFNLIGRPVDDFTSLIMCQRFRECGDFEIYIKATKETVDLFETNNFISKQEDTRLYMIESIVMVSDLGSGDYIDIKGRCLKSLLSRRIVWNQTNLTGTVETAIRKLISENAIEPVDPKRKIPGLELGTFRGYTETIEMQITGEVLLDKVQEICASYNYGFDIVYCDKKLIFELYKGNDRTAAQTENTQVIFGSDFDNLLSTDYEFNATGTYNVALVRGEGEGTFMKTSQYGDAAGIERREMYVDGSDISTNTGGINAEKYLLLLAEKGKEAVNSSSNSETFSAKVDINGVYKLDQDFSIGDIITIRTDYGIERNVRVVEVTENWAENGAYETDFTMEVM